VNTGSNRRHAGFADQACFTRTFTRSWGSSRSMEARLQAQLERPAHPDFSTHKFCSRSSIDLQRECNKLTKPEKSCKKIRPPSRRLNSTRRRPAIESRVPARSRSLRCCLVAGFVTALVGSTAHQPASADARRGSAPDYGWRSPSDSRIPSFSSRTRGLSRWDGTDVQAPAGAVRGRLSGKTVDPPR